MDRHDEDLMLAAGRGDQAAFTVLVERHYPAIVRYAQRYLGDVGRETAEDIAQDVFMRIWRRSAEFQPHSSVVAWLFRTATRACIDHRRRMRFRRALSLWSTPAGEATDRNPGPSDTHERDERAATVRTAIAQLPSRQRVALLLRHYDELPYAAIAETIGVSESSVESLLFRARRNLETKLRHLNREELPQDSRMSSANSW